jgi:hypothetical protein
MIRQMERHTCRGLPIRTRGLLQLSFSSPWSALIFAGSRFIGRRNLKTMAACFILVCGIITFRFAE